MFEYRVGDKVHIKNKKWYDSLKDCHGNISGSAVAFGFNSSMSKYCSRVGTVIKVVSIIYRGKELKRYKLNIDDGDWCWSMDMFDDRHFLSGKEMEIE